MRRMRTRTTSECWVQLSKSTSTVTSATSSMTITSLSTDPDSTSSADSHYIIPSMPRPRYILDTVAY